MNEEAGESAADLTPGFEIQHLSQVQMEYGEKQLENNVADAMRSDCSRDISPTRTTSRSSASPLGLILDNTVGVQGALPQVNRHAALISAASLVERVAYSFSDALFVYAMRSHDYLGEGAEKLFAAGQKNMRGAAVPVRKLLTRKQSASAMRAMALNGHAVAAFASCNSLLSMFTNMVKLSRDSLPAVFHVNAHGTGPNLELTACHDNIYAVRDAIAIINSSSLIEARDMALVAHVASLESGAPILHFYDSTVIDQIRVSPAILNIPEHQGLLEVASSIQTLHQDAISPCRSTLQQALTAALERVSRLLDRHVEYAPFEYSGPDYPRVVVVVLCAIAPPFIRYMKEQLNYSDIGVVGVRVYRPWLTDQFVQAVPPSAEKIVVFELTDGRGGAASPLYADVVISLRRKLYEKMSNVNRSVNSFNHNAESMRYSKVVSSTLVNIPQVRLHHVASVIHQAAVGDGYLDYRATPMHDLPQGLRQVNVWGRQHRPIEEEGVARAINELSDHCVVNVLRELDSYGVNGGVVRHFIRASEGAHDNCFIPEADNCLVDAVMCFDEDLMIAYDIVGSIKFSGSLIFNSEKPYDKLVASLDSWLLHVLRSQQITIRVVNVNAAALNSDAEAVDFIAAAILHGACEFISERMDKLSSYLMENAVSQVLDREVVKRGGSSITIPEALKFKTWHSSVLTADPPHVQQSACHLQAQHVLAWSTMFPHIYEGSSDRYFPPAYEKSFFLRVTSSQRLTPTDYDRDIFHIEFDTNGSGLSYEIGDALGVYGENDRDEVAKFLKWAKIDPKEVHRVRIPRKNGISQLQTAEQIATRILDLWGRPSKKFYEQLAKYASEVNERKELLRLSSKAGADDFSKLVDATVTYVDILKKFSSAILTMTDLLQVVQFIKPRHYSIASSQRVHPNAVHLLVVLVSWQDSQGRYRQGQCTRFLRSLQPGDEVVTTVKPSVMKLPPLTTQPVVMAGLGTGMAPFRAFIEERAWQAEQGMEIGPLVLYFGSRHRMKEYLYGEELELYHAKGILPHLRLAFSRDQKDKVYIQHKITEDQALIADLLLNRDASFYLCGPTWPAGDVRDAIADAFVVHGGARIDDIDGIFEKLKEQARYVLEVY